MGMIQAKRRVKNAPSLVLVPDAKWVEEIAWKVSSDAKTLMETFWPGPLTLLLLAHQELPTKVKKALTGAKGWFGVRLPDDEVSRNILQVFTKPILVSSANLAKKHGSNSVAQIKKNFGRTVDIMIDAGDLPSPQNSTLVDMTTDASAVIRAGLISEAQIMQALHVA
jgi:tRNA threonylcarbamoyl adenosine modification protein (Sua5/YciO/YrdC/YwlC family)